MKINIKGTVVADSEAWIYDLFGMPNINPAKVHDAIEKANGEALDVEINSSGGNVFAGSEIYSTLRAYEGDVRIRITGFCASAASVIAMAGYSEISPTAQIMVHNVSMSEAGDYHVHDKASEILQTANRSIAAAYVAKTGMEESEALAMMDKETWLTAEDAVEKGLCDAILEQKNTQLVAAFNAAIIPAAIINEYQERRLSIQAEIDKLKNMEV